VQFETRAFDGDGVRLTADAIGDRSAPPVLFFHGGGQSRRSWRGAARRVAEAGYYGLSFDLRGHGESGWAPDGDYILDAFGRDVEPVIAAFDRPVALVGASRGGQAALIGGSRHPGRVSLIMLADIAPRMRNTGIDKFRDFFAQSQIGFASAEEAADALALHLGQPRPADASSLMRALRQEQSGRLFWHWDPKTVDPKFLNPPSETQSFEAAAARVKCPVVLVRAELSDLVTQAGVDCFRALTPHLVVLEAKGVGHMFTGDRNDAFAATLLDYLAQHAPIAA